MSLVKGDNVLVEFYNDGNWKPYACARSCTFNASTSLIDTTVTGAGKYKHFTPEVNSFVLNIDGLSSLNIPSSVTISNLITYQLSHVLQRVRFTYKSEDNSYLVLTCDCFITGSPITTSFDNVSSFNVEMQGTGVPDVTIIEPPIIITKVKRYEFTASGGELGFTEPLLINKDILEVNKDGLGNSKIITSGAPASKEVKYTTGTGAFLWAVLFEAGEEAYVLYQDM